MQYDPNKAVLQGLFLNGFINGKESKLLVDTGAFTTMVSIDLFHRIPARMQPALLDPPVDIMTADGTLMDILGIGTMTVSVGDIHRTLQVTVAKIDHEAILGMDFLHDTRAVIDVYNKTLTLDGHVLQCKDERSRPFCARVVVASQRTIPAGHEAVVPCRLSKNVKMSGAALIETNTICHIAKRGLMIAPSLVQLEEEIFPLRVFNVKNKPVTLKEGTVGGKLISIKEEDLEESVCENQTEQADPLDLPPYLLDLYHRSIIYVHPSKHHLIANLLSKYKDIFSAGDHDLGRTDWTKHPIKTKVTAPTRERPRRTPVGLRAEVDRQVKDLLERGIIEPSNSPWSSPVVLVTKKDGSKRFCVDYRKLNSVTVYDAYPIPRIDDSLDALAGAKWFSTLDLASGYWQIELDEDAKLKSAFTVRGGHYQWNVMPFGLSTAPATFERLMERVMNGLQWEILLVYLDDIIVYGSSIEEEIHRLETTFQRLRAAKLKLKPSKCNLFQKEVLYLGHVVSEQGVSTDPAKIEAVKDWPVPTNVTAVRSFIGTASYYRRFMQGFANIARPLHQLMGKNVKFKWSVDCQVAFETLRDRLISAPILAYPDFTKSFILDTDASGYGMGAVLSQEHDGVERVIAYGSKTLKRNEMNYCVTRRELLAVVFFLKKFKHYLIGHHVTVRTDHGALQWLFRSKDPEGQLARWLESLSIFQLKIVHRPGRVHANADGLSRKPCSQCERNECGQRSQVSLTDDVTETRDNGVGHFTIQFTETDDQHDLLAPPTINAIGLSPAITNKDLRNAQLEDKAINPILIAKESTGARPRWEDVSPEPRPSKVYWSLWDLLVIRNGVLCRRWESDDGTEVSFKVILPEKLRNTILEELHSTKSAGHLGRAKLSGKVKQRYYWPGLDADIRSFIRKCNQCAQRKSPSKKRRAPLKQYQVGDTLERVAMDIVGPLPQTHDGNKYVLVVGDYWTKWMEAYPLPNAEAETVAMTFVQNFVCRYGVPLELHTDQGTNFESALFQEMCSTLGINKTRTTAYNPKSDGLIERYNRTLIDMVSSLLDPDKRQRDWDQQLPYACFAYRSAVQESTGETPNMLMLGREVRLPIDLMAPAPAEEDQTFPDVDFADDLRHRIRKAHDRVRHNLQQATRRQKKDYDRHATTVEVKVGDFVWLHNRTRKRGMTKKLASRWIGPFLILHKLSDVIIRIQRTKNSKPMVVHVDRTKPYQGEPIPSWLNRKVHWAPDEQLVKVVTYDAVDVESTSDKRGAAPDVETGMSDTSGTETEPDDGRRRNPRRQCGRPARYRDDFDSKVT